jgi:hypothetical protein
MQIIKVIKDPKTGITDVIHMCYSCDIEDYPAGKPIVNDPGATKDLNTGKWVCSSCQEESLNRMSRNKPSEGSRFYCS